MKQGSFRAVRLIIILFVVLSMTGLSAYGDQNTVDLQSFVLEPFMGDTSHVWVYGGKTYSFDFEWRVDASRFASVIDGVQFPKMTYVEAWPQNLFGTNREGHELRSLGIWGKFDRRGYNWIDLYPVLVGGGEDGNGDPEPFEIPIPGRLLYMDVWAWGSNLNYYVEAYFRDYQGVVHNLYMGSLAYQGWRNLRVTIPTSIRQSRRILPSYAGLTFVKFRIWTTPMERVDDFYIYFNQMKILTDVFETLFDGDDLADPDHVQELWGQAQTQR